VVIRIAVTVNDAITFTSPLALPPAHMNGTYPGTTITTAGGTGAVTMIVSGGALPANLSISGGGAVSGTTTDATGTYNFTVTATDSQGATASQAFSIDVIDSPLGLPTITNASALPTGTLNAAYGPLDLAVTGGTGPFTFSLDSGTLPNGLNLSASGTIDGTPLALGVSTFNIRIVDSSSRALFNTQSFTLSIVAPKKEDESGCVGTAGATAPVWMAVVAMVAAIRRRRD
jgi:hypothetical protein